jgi:hypothetical protein
VLARTTANGARIGYGQEAVLINNVWNPAGALRAFSSSVYLRQGEIFGWQWSSDRADQVVAYPELFFGESAWWGLGDDPGAAHRDGLEGGHRRVPRRDRGGRCV